jgi:DNA invertase Pin-like site-specific DNA recombinase
VVGPEFVDAKSARDDNRPGFQAMFDVVQSGNASFDLVLVHSYSRFYREDVGLELYYRTLRKRKIELISITQDVGEGSTADLIRQIIALPTSTPRRRRQNTSSAASRRMPGRASSTDHRCPSGCSRSWWRFAAGRSRSAWISSLLRLMSSGRYLVFI